MIRILEKPCHLKTSSSMASFLKQLLNDLYALGAAVHQMNHSNVKPFRISAQIRL
jgi:hypothetical protein